MTSKRDQKALVRARMAKTGERYAVARRHVLASRPPPQPETPTRNENFTVIQVPNFGLMPLAAAVVVGGGWSVPCCPFCGTPHLHGSGEGSRLAHCGVGDYYVRIGGGPGPALPFGQYTDPQCEPHVEELFGEIAARLIHSDDRVGGELAMTNASGFGLEDGSVNWAIRAGDKIVFSATVDLSGDHDADAPFNGDALTADVAGTLERNDGTWQLADCQCYSASTNADDE